VHRNNFSYVGISITTLSVLSFLPSGPLVCTKIAPRHVPPTHGERGLFSTISARFRCLFTSLLWPR